MTRRSESKVKQTQRLKKTERGDLSNRAESKRDSETAASLFRTSIVISESEMQH